MFTVYSKILYNVISVEIIPIRNVRELSISKKYVSFFYFVLVIKMVNKCVATNCKTGYSNGQKKSTFHFPEESSLQERWIYFFNRKYWVPSKYSAICVDHFDDKFIKYGKRRSSQLFKRIR